MWLWDIELRALGFRRKSERYWQCLRRFELPDAAYLSLFSWSEQFIPAGNGRYLGDCSKEIGLFLISFNFVALLSVVVPAGGTSHETGRIRPRPN